jgi:peptidoglycan/xylan/chitin deacetylase (PgdA/CDA1 family)
MPKLPLLKTDTAMTRILILLLTAMACELTNSLSPLLKAQPREPIKPKIAFTFDDGSISDFGEYKLEVWNQLLLNQLKKNKVKAILFSAGANKSSPKGKYVLSSWNNSGHLIANHSISHVNFNSENTSLEAFKLELSTNDRLIKSYSNYYPYFRFPYL